MDRQTKKIHQHPVNFSDEVELAIFRKMYKDYCCELAQYSTTYTLQEVVDGIDGDVIEISSNKSASVTFITAKDGTYVGFLILKDWGRWTTFIDQFYIRPEFRHKGIGRSVMKQVLKDKKYYVLDIFNKNGAAHIFWRSVMSENKYEDITAQGQCVVHPDYKAFTYKPKNKKLLEV